MIVTITPNPSVDRTLHVRELVPGAVLRADSESVEPSGKGVNVALAVHRVGGDVVALLPAAGHAGAHLEAMLEEAGLPHEIVVSTGETRSNVSLVEPDGTTTKINESGPELPVDRIRQLAEAARRISRPGEWVVWCGSLPRGFTPQELATRVATGRAAGRRIGLDSSGEALKLAVAGPPEGLPHLIKPNTEELADLTGRSLMTVGDVADAALSLVERGIDTVLVSLGADGAVLVEKGTVLYGFAEAERVANTAGAGDAFLAGYLAAGEVSAEARLTSALQFGAAAVAQPGTVFVRPPTFQSATVAAPDRDQPLDEPVLLHVTD